MGRRGRGGHLRWGTVGQRSEALSRAHQWLDMMIVMMIRRRGDGSGVDNDQVLFSNIDLRRINNLPSPLPLGPSFDRCLDLIFSGWYPEIMTLFQGGPERANLYGHLLKSLRILSGYDVCLASLWARQGRPGWLFMEQWHQVGFSPATVTIHVGSLTC